MNALQSQVSRLRGRLHLAVEAVPGGYRLAVEPQAVDAHRFEHLAVRGREALTLGDPARAAGLLRDALGLWRGPALADLPSAHARAARYEELRLAAVEDSVEAGLALGGGPGLIAELRELISAQPLREALYGQLMRALHLAGRTAEALAVYEHARRTLADELGADPSAGLAALHVGLLKGGSHRPTAPAQPMRPAPRTGRTPNDGALHPPSTTPSAPPPPPRTRTSPRARQPGHRRPRPPSSPASSAASTS
ncbi:hypothetical protein Sm713_18770 [Streptomyces sp. TS71-3]|nr:AfsR/SARP family transcriptional regulator [Streptomyces sp. TS71-3]GHJ36268.1 hypothetical protein Sm713_18770 [Streptomyces sp. TS71-3]